MDGLEKISQSQADEIFVGIGLCKSVVVADFVLKAGLEGYFIALP